MKSIKSSVELPLYQKEIVDALQDQDYIVFLDTNVIAWAFRLNDTASLEFQQWLETLALFKRLVIPAWTVHEYNKFLRDKNPSFFLPHKAIGKALNKNLDDLDRISHLMVSDFFANENGYNDKSQLINELSNASETIKQFLKKLDPYFVNGQDELIEFFEELITKCSHQNNVHKLAAEAANEAIARYTNQLSPGFKDGSKAQDSFGDLIIWKEILYYCKSNEIKKVIFVTNDVKSDWVYTPLNVILSNGVKVSGSNEKSKLVKYPNPELVAEFKIQTGSDDLYILAIDSIIEQLSSDLNNSNPTDFTHLASAIKIDIPPTQTDNVIQWFFDHHEKYQEAIRSVCYWNDSPAEVDLDEFKTWTSAQMGNIDIQKVRWTEVFCELFL